MRGGEKVVEALCEMFPQADIFTHVYDPGRVSATIRRHTVRTTFIQRLPLARRLYQRYLPLMPLALEQLDLRGYDIVISSESGPAKGVITRPDALHLCYCHTPMRYLWNMYHDYLDGAGRLTRLLMPWLAHHLRLWDQQTASRVDVVVANSHNVARRIRSYWGREATVVHPPVDTDAFRPAERGGADDFYLCAGQLTRL
jgi:glycosyltransferase involved in cell wall biosynthesis